MYRQHFSVMQYSACVATYERADENTRIQCVVKRMRVCAVIQLDSQR